MARPRRQQDGSKPAPRSGHSASGAVRAAAEPPDPAAMAAGRLLRRLERKDLTGRLAAVDRERREAPALVEELLSHPAPPAGDARYATPEVVWRLLEVSRDQEPQPALRQLGLARKIAIHLAALRPAAALPMQLRAEVGCETAHRLLDAGELTAAAVLLSGTAASLRPDLGYARAVFCRALARLRRAEQRWEEALALGDRAVRLFEEHAAAGETAAAAVEQAWTLLDAGDADEAVPIFERALAQVEGIPYSAVAGRLGLAIALRESGQAADARERQTIDELLAEAEWMFGQSSTAADQSRLRSLVAQAAARCRRG
jgi:tetratricopeptide (TPR) repeat protein